jgi:prophage DNA circulation protein
MIEIEGQTDNYAPGSFRGIPFWMPQADDETGRRAKRFFFPGQDTTAFQDLGAFDGPINVTGFVIGDDFVDQMAQLKAAFRTAGPGLLVHPWLGQINVVLTEPVKVQWQVTEQRVARFTATFAPYFPPQPPVADTVGATSAAVEDVNDDSGTLIGVVLAPATLTLALVDATEGVCAVLGTIWAVAAAVTGTIAAAVAIGAAVLGTVETFTLDDTYAGAVYAAIAAPSAAIVVTSETLLPAAIGPGDLVPTSITVDPRVTTAAILAAQCQILALATAQAAVLPLVLAAAAIAVSDAVSASQDIVFSSQEDATTWLATLTSAIDATALLAEHVAPSQPLAAGTVWRDLQAMRGAVAANINAVIGSLPVVQDVTLTSAVPVWLIVQGLYGDTPGNMLAAYNDIVARNVIANPSLTGPGEIEALVA